MLTTNCHDTATARAATVASTSHRSRSDVIEIHAKLDLRFLAPDEYPLWDALVNASPQGTVLCRSWLLNAIPGNVQVLGYFRAGQLIAGIPLYFEGRLGVTLCRMPRLVHTWGVVMEPAEGKTATVLSREMEILRIFAKELASYRFFVQSFHPSLTNWLPFYWEGFSQRLRLGYVFEDLSNLDGIWDGMAGNLRRNIRKAEKSGIKVHCCESDVVATMLEKTFRKQNKKPPASVAYIKRLHEAAKQNDAGACFAAMGQDGRIHAASLMIWDFKRAYYFVAGSDPELRASGADSLLLWDLIKFTADRAKAFDFAGSMFAPVEKFERSFGAKLIPYSQIFRIPRMARLIFP